MNKILLMGNPNVGKSVFFSEYTGKHVLSSNFAGTTVSFMEGQFTLGETDYTLIDVPGTYSLNPTSDAEAISARFVQEGASAILYVLDATNLQRNLELALQVRQQGIPMVYALNLTDVARRRGIIINTKLLAQELGAAVVETIAVKKQGLDELKQQLELVLQQQPTSCSSCANCSKCKAEENWATAKEIARRVTQTDGSNPSFIDRLGDKMMKPWPGLLIAAGVLVVLVLVVRYGGAGLRVPLIMLTDHVIIPFFRWAFEGIFAFFASEGTAMSYRYLFYDAGFHTGLRVFADGAFHSVAYGTQSANLISVLLNVLIGEHGVFVISFQWIIALILPYVFTFYLAITFLEDSGYLPRVSVLFDNLMRKLGVQGGSMIHMFLALGCAIPAILGSRTATTKKERLTIATIICFSVPCISQIGALIALMTAPGFAWWLAPLMLAFAILLFMATALIASKLLKGKVDPLMIEVPNLLMPEPKAYFRKLVIRMKHFLKDAELPMLAAVFLAALLAGTGVIGLLARNAGVQAVVSGWLGMPEEAVIALILGVVRREMSVAPLLLLELTHLQAFVAGVVSLLYLPCLSVIGVIAKEFKIKTAVIIFFGTVLSALLVGGIINQVVRLFM